MTTIDAGMHGMPITTPGEFRCPCGRVGSPASMAAHRRRWDLHPECKGEMVQVSGPPNSFGFSYDGPPIAPEHFKIPDDVTDPEEVARFLNLQRGASDDDPDDASQSPQTGWLGLDPPDGASPPAGDFDWLNGMGDDDGSGGMAIEEPPPDAKVTTQKLTVVLPIKVYAMYDAIRSSQTDLSIGSIEDFITTAMVDHFMNCWGLDLALIRKWDVARPPEADPLKEAVLARS